MKFLIFEARKENEELYLSGYFRPKKRCESESKVIKKMINIFQEGAVDKPDFVKIKDTNKSKGTNKSKDKILAFYSATPNQISKALKLMDRTSDFTAKPVVNIRYDGINEKELTDTLKVFKDWSKITIVESK